MDSGLQPGEEWKPAWRQRPARFPGRPCSQARWIWGIVKALQTAESGCHRPPPELAREASSVPFAFQAGVSLDRLPGLKCKKETDSPWGTRLRESSGTREGKRLQTEA